jgi:uncharacterized protein (TIGR03083 family)
MREVDRHLVGLLTSLTSAEWELPTIAPGWSVRDIAAHLLDTALRKLSGGRDRCHIERVEIRSHQDVITLVNRLKREGVTVYRRLSPAVLSELMQLACGQTADYLEALDPFSEASIGVSWPGEMKSLVWFDNARELTEWWHHQEQIRLATYRSSIIIPTLYHRCWTPSCGAFLTPIDVIAPVGTAILARFPANAAGNGAWLSRTRVGFSPMNFRWRSPLISLSRKPSRGACSRRALVATRLIRKSRFAVMRRLPGTCLS